MESTTGLFNVTTIANHGNRNDGPTNPWMIIGPIVFIVGAIYCCFRNNQRARRHANNRSTAPRPANNAQSSPRLADNRQSLRRTETETTDIVVNVENEVVSVSDDLNVTATSAAETGTSIVVAYPIDAPPPSYSSIGPFDLTQPPPSYENIMK